MPQTTLVSIEHTVAVSAPIKDVFERWSRMEEFPSFMEGVRELSWLDDKRFLLKSEASGQVLESVCELTLRIPDQRMAWRTISGPDSSGVVSFQATDAGVTEVTLKMLYDPETGWSDREELERRLALNLGRFKALVEG
ncbi:MAG: hypothetical protein QOE70_6328 [Chthoniobacter sp.]|jgi:uncharacterized membrane protein|nr:hypothetical protein [Chthoniobacter sp.]